MTWDKRWQRLGAGEMVMADAKMLNNLVDALNERIAMDRIGRPGGSPALFLQYLDNQDLYNNNILEGWLRGLVDRIRNRFSAASRAWLDPDSFDDFLMSTIPVPVTSDFSEFLTEVSSGPGSYEFDNKIFLDPKILKIIYETLNKMVIGDIYLPDTDNFLSAGRSGSESYIAAKVSRTGEDWGTLPYTPYFYFSSSGFTIHQYLYYAGTPGSFSTSAPWIKRRNPTDGLWNSIFNIASFDPNIHFIAQIGDLSDDPQVLYDFATPPIWRSASNPGLPFDFYSPLGALGDWYHNQFNWQSLTDGVFFADEIFLNQVPAFDPSLGIMRGSYLKGVDVLGVQETRYLFKFYWADYRVNGFSFRDGNFEV